MERPLLILDLDETLIHRRNSPLDRPGTFQIDDFHVYERPFLREFLAGAETVFDLGVWSSASPAYVSAITDRLFPDRGNCASSGPARGVRLGPTRTRWNCTGPRISTR